MYRIMKSTKPITSLTDDELAGFIKRAQALPDAPAAYVQRAVDVWNAKLQTAPQAVVGASLKEVATAGKDAADAVLEHIRAVLSFDSWTVSPAALGLRSMPSQTRRLLFSAQGRDIDLRINPSVNHYALAGQILGPDEDGAIEISGEIVAPPGTPVGGRITRIVTFDEFGSFRLEDVAAGTYHLTLRMRHTVIELPPIQVGDRKH
jgi:hypothetical protein